MALGYQGMAGSPFTELAQIGGRGVVKAPGVSDLDCITVTVAAIIDQLNSADHRISRLADALVGPRPEKECGPEPQPSGLLGTLQAIHYRLSTVSDHLDRCEKGLGL